jgi:hypothetical protein
MAVRTCWTCHFFFLEAFCDISHRLGGITPFGVFSDPFSGLKMWVTFACATANFLIHFLISIAVLENLPPDAGLQKNALFHTKRRSGRDRESRCWTCHFKRLKNRTLQRALNSAAVGMHSFCHSLEV